MRRSIPLLGGTIVVKTYVPTISEFQEVARKEFSFLLTEYDFVETKLDVVKYFNPCAVRYENDTTVVRVEGIGHGYSTNVDIGIRTSSRKDVEQGFPLWPLMKLRAPNLLGEYHETGGQLKQLKICSQALRKCAQDVLSGDFEVRAEVTNILNAWFETKRKKKLEADVQQACNSASQAFREKNFARVVEILSEYEAFLTSTQRKKLEYAKRHNRKKYWWSRS